MAIGSLGPPEPVRPRTVPRGCTPDAGTRRTADRVQFQGRANIVMGDQRIPARTGDLSEAGAYVHTRVAPETGETVLFTVRLDDTLTLATEATVVWVDTDAEGDPTGCGLAFVRLSNATRRALSLRLRPAPPTPVMVEEVVESRLATVITRFIDRIAG